MAPIIAFVPGHWEGPTVFDGVRQRLEAAGFTTTAIPLVATGHFSPGNPSLQDDIDGIRAAITKLVDNEQREVVLALHSVGGALGSSAIEGLDVNSRKAKGQPGGVVKIIFMAAGILPPGAELKAPPFVETREDGGLYCKDMENALFHDVPDKQKWISVMRPQPIDYEDTIKYAGWQHVPSTYVIAESDKLFPVALQEQFAGGARSNIHRLAAGHMLMLVKPDELAKIIAEETPK